MKQLPADCMLDPWLSKGLINSKRLKRMAEKISRFHSEAAKSPEISRFREIERWEIYAAQKKDFDPVGKSVRPCIFLSIAKPPPRRG